MPGRRTEEFYNSGSFLLIGMSKKKDNFAWSIYKTFSGDGRNVYTLHPDGGEKKGVEFFRDIEDLPVRPEACIICTDLKKNDALISELADSGIKKVWLQQGSYDKSVLEKTAERGLDPFTGCVLMYFPGISFGHRLHRFFHDLFSKGKN